MRYAIVEDNPFAAEHLRQLVSSLRKDWELVFTADSVEQTAKELAGGAGIDFMFMDIELEDGKCFKLFEKIKTTMPIIFTTAYDEYAIQAFKVNGIDYILKPISKKDLGFALDKMDMIARTKKSAEAETVPQAIQTERLLTTSSDQYSYIDISDVSWFICEDNCVFAMMKGGGSKLLTLPNLSELEKVLPPQNFFRVSRNVIASIKSIRKVSKYLRGRLLVNVGEGKEMIEVCISAPRRDDFLKWMGR